MRGARNWVVPKRRPQRTLIMAGFLVTIAGITSTPSAPTVSR